ncbi:MAG: OmpA family protein, partial [Ignavibacteriales bacterium]|nr:OmpA family protein [Ignavibacteriales bacterium]
MKKILVVLLLLATIVTAQDDTLKVYKSGLYLGASGIYPHYMTITDKSIATHKNFGFGFHVGYDVSEHFGFRLSTNYVLLGSFWYGDNGEEQDNFLNMATANIDAIYNILPCEIISPYIIAGYGFTWFKSSNPYLGPNKSRDWIKEAFTGNQFQLGLGAEFKFWDDIHIKAEVDYITATNNKIDGNEHANGVKGLLYSNGDTYMNLKLGASWYFWRGERSKICEPFSIREIITEVPVEKIIKDTVYVDKIIEKAIVERESFVLQNVRFKFDQDILTKESEIILQNAAKVLNKYPNEKIEILGHTDSWGSDEYNMDL